MEDRIMDAQLIATHRRPALVAAIITLVATLVACDGKGVDVAVVGIPDGATVSVDALPWFQSSHRLVV